jgi:hypothetical protein
LQANILLSNHTLSAIDVRIEKILKDLGHPEPPLRLEDVRRLLKLDLGYYSATDTSWLKDKIHQLRVAGKQILSEPSTILAVTRSLGLKGVLLVDRRRILLDTDIAAPKLRWNEAHEITHDVLPWHEGLAHGDPEATLSPACHEQLEAEANYGAGRLLFCGTAFSETVRSSSLSFELVKRLKKIYGNTLTSTLWRLVEATQHRAFGLVSVHPGQAKHDEMSDIRYFIRSPLFAAEYALAQPTLVFDTICAGCYGRKGPLGSGELVLANDRGESRTFKFETFWNGYDALTLGHSK